MDIMKQATVSCIVTKRKEDHTMFGNIDVTFDNGVRVYTWKDASDTLYLQIADDEHICLDDYDDEEICTMLTIMSSITHDEVHTACAYSMGDEEDWLEAFKAVKEGRVFKTGCASWVELAKQLAIRNVPFEKLGNVNLEKYTKNIHRYCVIRFTNDKPYYGHYFYDVGTHMVYGVVTKEYKLEEEEE